MHQNGKNFITQHLSKELRNKGIDGFWVDNLDVFDFN